MKSLKKYILIIGFLACGFLVAAHPHMFFSSTEEFVFQDNKLAGCWLEWTFDSYFSADIIYTYDILLLYAKAKLVQILKRWKISLLTKKMACLSTNFTLI